MKKEFREKNMFENVARRIKTVIDMLRLSVKQLTPSNQWLDIKLVRHGLDMEVTNHRLYLDPESMSFDMWVFEASGELVNIRLLDLLEIDLDYHTNQTFTGGAGWSAYIIGKGMGGWNEF